jgi:hypothetical protein
MFSIAAHGARPNATVGPVPRPLDIPPDPVEVWNFGYTFQYYVENGSKRKRKACGNSAKRCGEKRFGFRLATKTVFA